MQVSSHLETMSLKYPITSFYMEVTLYLHTIMSVLICNGVTFLMASFTLAEIYNVYNLICARVIFQGAHIWYGIDFSVNHLIVVCLSPDIAVMFMTACFSFNKVSLVLLIGYLLRHQWVNMRFIYHALN